MIEASLLYRMVHEGRITVNSEEGAKRADMIDRIAALYVEGPERFGIKGLAIRAMGGVGVTHYKPIPNQPATVAAATKDDLAAHGFF